MRLFIAITLSDAMKDALIDVQNTMYEHGVRGNYTKEENLHLTLAFIGEYPDPEAVLDASFAAKAIYLRRGYTETGYDCIACGNGDFLCHDTMRKIFASAEKNPE